MLLQCPYAFINPHLPSIIATTTFLTSLTISHNGHLPSSLPARDRSEPLVQVCHGSPGLLLLLATFRRRFPEEWKDEWNEAQRMASDRVWEEGILKKGSSVCHGITGNAWPWLFLSRFEEGLVFFVFLKCS